MHPPLGPSKVSTDYFIAAKSKECICVCRGEGLIGFTKRTEDDEIKVDEWPRGVK